MSFVKKIGLYKWVNLMLLISLSLALLFTSTLVTAGWCINNCSFELKNGFIDPLYRYISLILISVSILLLLPSRYFKHWLLFFASWAIPLSLVVIFSESQYSTGGVLGLAGREFNATIMGGLLVVGTILFICGKAIYSWFKTKK